LEKCHGLRSFVKYASASTINDSALGAYLTLAIYITPATSIFIRDSIQAFPDIEKKIWQTSVLGCYKGASSRILLDVSQDLDCEERTVAQVSCLWRIFFSKYQSDQFYEPIISIVNFNGSSKIVFTPIQLDAATIIADRDIIKRFTEWSKDKKSFGEIGRLVKFFFQIANASIAADQEALKKFFIDVLVCVFKLIYVFADFLLSDCFSRIRYPGSAFRSWDASIMQVQPCFRL